MKNSKALKEERAQKLEEFQGLMNKGKTGSLTAEETQRCDTLTGEVEKLNSEIEAAEKREKLDAQIIAKSFERSGDKGEFSERDKQDLRKYRLSKALMEKRSGKVLTGVEAEVEQHYAEERNRLNYDSNGLYIPSDFIRFGKGNQEQRDAFTIGTEGADVMQTTLGNVIPFLQPKPVVVGMGATMLTGLTGDFQLPRFTNNATISALAETGSITDTTITTDNKKLSPKRYGGEIDWTIQAGMQSSFALEQMLRSMIEKAVAIAVDAGALKGSGSSNQVTGLINYSGVGAVALGTNGAAPTWAKLLEFISDVSIANALDGSLGFLTTPAARAKMMSTPKQSSGVEGNFLVNMPNELLGYNLTATNQLPSDLTKGSGSALSAMVFGDWSQLMLGYFGGVNLVFDNLTKRRDGKECLIIEQYFDIEVAQETAFSVCLDMVTT